MKTSKSIGLGDSVAKFTKFFGLDKLATFIARLRGKEDCGCDRRRRKLNNIVPYKHLSQDLYVFTGTRKFTFLEDARILRQGVPVLYKAGEVIYIDPSMDIYYELRDLLITNILICNEKKVKQIGTSILA